MRAVTIYAVLLSALLPAVAQAQSWRMAVEPCSSADAVPWPTSVPAGDFLSLAEHFQGQGYLTARVDTLTSGIACVRRGRYYGIARTRGEGQALLDLEGDSLRAAGVESAAFRVLEDLERKGFVQAEVRFTEVDPTPQGLHLSWEVDPGYRPVLLGVLTSGGTRASDAYLRRVTGLRPGRRLHQFDAQELRRRLRETGLFERVDLPRLVPTADSTAVVQLVLTDRAPGSFDLALGYLPASAGGAATLVGSGDLLLRNLFGGGRTFSVELNRLPGSASRFGAVAEDPFVLGQNLGASLRFDGYQADSTYSRQDYGAAAHLRLGATTVNAFASRVVTRPGTAGIRVEQGRQRVADARARFAGFGLAWSSVDDPLRPTAGLDVSLRVLRGRKIRSGLEVTGGDTLRVERGLPQDRLEGRLRWHLRLTERVVVVTGGEISTIAADEVDVSDLYRLGGAASLRGYDEDRFTGRTVGRGLVEARRLLPGLAHVYVFLDVGLVDSPPAGAPSGWFPGFGVGGRLDTAAGLLDVSYAVNREDGLASGRVHFGIAFGL